MASPAIDSVVSCTYPDRMYQVKLLRDGKDYDPIVSETLATPFEPREGLVYRFRERADMARAVRYKVTRVEVDQVWGDTANGVAWVYVTKVGE
jgi:hypothetical protein